MKNALGRVASALTVICLVTGPAMAGTIPSSGSKTIETAGTALAITLPLVAGAITLAKHDRTGTAQLIAETLLTVGTAYGLKSIVRERRPDGSDFKSFPSDTTALSASGSSFLWGRYGWEYGLPALAVTQFVSYSRVQAKQHHWYDTLASSALAAGYGYILTTPFQERYHIETSVAPAPDGGILQFAYHW